MIENLFWLNSLVSLDPRLVGGKACGLAKLFKMGARVPEGIVIPADIAINEVIERELDEAITILLAKCGPSTRFAVRSSATVEDGVAASYAGMFKTVLDVGGDDVAMAVADCRQSAKSARIDTYRSVMKRADEATAPVAIVVQRMLNPSCSGVCFTINPITGDTDEMVIEVAIGVGERVVSGIVTPDYYCMRLTDGALLCFEPGEDSVNGEPLLSEGDRLLVCTEAKTVSESFGLPIDIEFAFAEDILYLLQARPITMAIKRVEIA